MRTLLFFGTLLVCGAAFAGNDVYDAMGNYVGPSDGMPHAPTGSNPDAWARYYGHALSTSTRAVPAASTSPVSPTSTRAVVSRPQGAIASSSSSNARAQFNGLRLSFASRYRNGTLMFDCDNFSMPAGGFCTCYVWLDSAVIAYNGSQNVVQAEQDYDFNRSGERRYSAHIYLGGYPSGTPSGQITCMGSPTPITWERALSAFDGKVDFQNR